jgi:uncharacterized protein (DUF2141 family)
VHRNIHPVSRDTQRHQNTGAAAVCVAAECFSWTRARFWLTKSLGGRNVDASQFPVFALWQVEEGTAVLQNVFDGKKDRHSRLVTLGAPEGAWQGFPRQSISAEQRSSTGLGGSIRSELGSRRAAKRWRSRVGMLVSVPALWAGCFAVAVLGTVSEPGSAQTPCPGIHVKVLNIRNSTGTVACALFESPEGFPKEFLRSATNVMVIKVRKQQARCDFEDIPPGTYAVVVVHDENMNGKLDTNVFGIPTEGYGFSNDATAMLGVPSFQAASFAYDGRSLDFTLSLHY